jgi:hypothetical protein
MKVKENMNRTSSGSLSLQKDTSVPFVKNTTKDQKMVQMYGLSRINDVLSFPQMFMAVLKSNSESSGPCIETIINP